MIGCDLIRMMITVYIMRLGYCIVDDDQLCADQHPEPLKQQGHESLLLAIRIKSKEKQHPEIGELVCQPWVTVIDFIAK